MASPINFGPYAPPTTDELEKMNALRQGFSSLVQVIEKVAPQTSFRDNSLEFLASALAELDQAIRFGRGRLTPNVMADFFRDVECKEATLVPFTLTPTITQTSASSDVTY